MLGTHIHPDHLLRDLTDEEWRGWLWYMDKEPFGFPERDVRHGMLCASFFAPYAQRGRAPDPRNFMLRQPPERDSTPKETEAFLDAIFGIRKGPAPNDGEEE